VTAVLLGGRVLAPTVAARLQGALLEALTSFHTENPLALGANRRELKRGRLGHLSPRLFDALVEQLASSSSVQVDGPLVRVVGFEVGLDADEQALKARLEKSIQQAGVGGIKPKELHAKHKEAEVSALLRLVESEGTAHQLPGLGWVAQTSLDELRVRLKRWFAQNEAIDPGAFKELTQLTRKGAIPLMEWMDSQKWTRRTGDRRVQGKAL